MSPIPNLPPRVEPLAPPYEPELQALLRRMTPPGAPSILALFRVLAHNPGLAERSTGWGAYLLGRKATLPLRDREVVIDRVCARCGAQYEWGVHVAAFGEAAGFDAQQTADLRWIRQPFLDHRGAFGKFIIHGHTPMGEVDVQPNRIGIDTGAAYGGKLTAIGLESMQRWFLSVG